MQLLKVSLAGALLLLGGCYSSYPRSCATAGAISGLTLVGGGMAGGFLMNQVGVRGIEHKIANGESIHEAVGHGENRTRDLIVYAALPAGVAAAAIGGYLGYKYCSDKEKENETLIRNQPALR